MDYTGNWIYLALVVFSFYGLGMLFLKMGLMPWKAYIPVYNFWIYSKALGKPGWWGLLMLVPGVNLMMYGVYGFLTARAFNRTKNADMALAIILPYVFFYTSGRRADLKFSGLEKYNPEPNSFIKNWADPIIFAVIAASVIRGYFIEAFTIPTSSLEKSLMVGDFLFVNKFAYGPKLPQTPFSFPFAHHTMPLTESVPSYMQWLKLPYLRLPGFGTVKNNHIVVFNYPDGDTVAIKHQNTSYYQIIRDLTEQEAQNNPHGTFSTWHHEAWMRVHQDVKTFGPVVGRPVDKRDHYVKRCIAIAGDTLRIKNAEVYINGKLLEKPQNLQHHYFVKSTSDFVTQEWLDQNDIYVTEAFKVSRYIDKRDTLLVMSSLFQNTNNGIPLPLAERKALQTTFNTNDTLVYCLNLTALKAKTVAQDPRVAQVVLRTDRKSGFDSRIFPHDTLYPWNNDWFGPLWIPKAGTSIRITRDNFYMYEKILSTYDDGIHQVQLKGNVVLYDGAPLYEYTFKQDYYFMMGDNRHNSADSRCWGFVPYDHVVGSPFFVWASVKYEENNPVSGKSFVKSLFKNEHDGKYRWSRFLCYVENGNLHSVKWPFISCSIALWLFFKWRKKRKKDKT